MEDFIFLNKKNIPKELRKKSIALNDRWYLYHTSTTFLEYNITGYKIIIIGDYLGSVEDLFRINDNDIPKQKGNFYAIIVKRDIIKVYSSFFSILPIYYCQSSGAVSSSISFIRKYSNNEGQVDRKFLLEQLLFNYGFFNRTLYDNISLVPCHSSIKITYYKISIHKNYDIKNDFILFPNKGNNVVNHLSDLFISTTKDYFPNKEFDIAFTSGFDGRTLVSCALHHNRNFKTFSFGRPSNADVSIPLKNAEELDIPYQYFDLGEETYLNSKFYENALELGTSGYLGNGFLYPHFLYSTKEIARDSKYLVSGAMGSELFRALHTSGAVTSQALVDIFMTNDEKHLASLLKNAGPLQILKLEGFASDLDELIEEIILYKRALPSELSPNQRFYIFVFEEIFRKFFGQWITLQQKHLKVRTPFLDYNFVKELLATSYAGANNDFFTENPIKRMKGQYIYADIIKKTNNTIYKQETGKGYRPIDVRDYRYTHNIVLPFVKKRLTRKVTKTNLDNLGIISGMKVNSENIKTLLDQGSNYFKTEELKMMLEELTPFTLEKERDNILMGLSLLLNLNTPYRKVDSISRKLDSKMPSGL